MKAKNGISLIVLVITIVVIIILAAAVILSLGNNNPINNSRVAAVSQAKDNVESAVTMYLSSKFAKTLGNYDAFDILSADAKIDTTTYGTFTAVIETTATTIGGETYYEIKKDAAKTVLEVDITKEAGTWYLNPSNGRVMIKYGPNAIPSYLMDGTKVNSAVQSFVTE